MRKRAMGLMLLLSSFSLLNALELEAQCHIQQFCVAGTLEEGDELTPPHPYPWGVTAEPTFYHSSCLVCAEHDGDQGVCHYGCIPEQEQEEEEQEELQLAHLTAFHAFLNEDLPGILEEARRLKSYLYWNESRRAIQLLSCSGGAVIASIAVEPDQGAIVTLARLRLADISDRVEPGNRVETVQLR